MGTEITPAFLRRKLFEDEATDEVESVELSKELDKSCSDSPSPVADASVPIK